METRITSLVKQALVVGNRIRNGFRNFTEADSHRDYLSYLNELCGQHLEARLNPNDKRIDYTFRLNDKMWRICVEKYETRPYRENPTLIGNLCFDFQTDGKFIRESRGYIYGDNVLYTEIATPNHLWLACDVNHFLSYSSGKELEFGKELEKIISSMQPNPHHIDLLGVLLHDIWKTAKGLAEKEWLDRTLFCLKSMDYRERRDLRVIAQQFKVVKTTPQDFNL